MCKNEESTIIKTMSSGLGNGISGWVIYDTGSTDSTLELIEKFKTEHNANVWIKQGTFVDFAVSRNEMLDFADTITELDYCFLLDCNDELRSASDVPDIIRKLNYPTAFQVRQELTAGTAYTNTVFYNTRCLKLREGWRYEKSMPVHEYLVAPPGKTVTQFPEPDKFKITIYQDRTVDSHKTRARFERDEKMLKRAYKISKGKNTRVIYYLAQTLMSQQKYAEAIKYYSKHYRMYMDGTGGQFKEESYNAALNTANCIKANKGTHEDYVEWLKKAWLLEHRADPLVKLAMEYHSEKQDNWTAYMYAHTACKLKFPKDAMLFVDEHYYNYTRWHLLSVICYHLDDSLSILEEGLDAVIRASNDKPDNETDQTNLKAFYRKMSILYPGQTKFEIPLTDNVNNNTKLPDSIWKVNLQLIRDKELALENYSGRSVSELLESLVEPSSVKAVCTGPYILDSPSLSDSESITLKM